MNLKRHPNTNASVKVKMNVLALQSPSFGAWSRKLHVACRENHILVPVAKVMLVKPGHSAHR